MNEAALSIRTGGSTWRDVVGQINEFSWTYLSVACTITDPTNDCQLDVLDKMNSAAEVKGMLLNITAVERETGLSKDVLRMWERRYGYPKPDRDAKQSLCR